MKEYISAKEMAMRWGVTERRVTGLCKDGSIKGAFKDGRSWCIPINADKPADNRITTGLYVHENISSSRKPLPVGVSDFRVASSRYYYVDKTMLIKDILDDRPAVTLFTRPRRFGKTLNMDMIRTYFEKADEDTSVYFLNKNIWKQGNRYRSFQGKYPVIFLSFKDVKKSGWKETYSNIKLLIQQEYLRHEELGKSKKIKNVEYYRKVINGKISQTEFEESLKMLTVMLNEHYGIPAVVIIDEYDTPIQSGYSFGFYEDVIRFMRNLLSGCFKDNKNLEFGFLTGILRIAKESIFSGLNNLVINSVLDNKYSEYFGFTPEEVRKMAIYYNAPERYNELCEWYDGYRFGKSEIFNPWSVINYFSNECEPRAYWLSTGSNEIIKEVLKNANADIYNKLTALINGETFTSYIDTNVVFPEIENNPSSIYSFLLVSGYLKVVQSTLSMSGDFMCEVALPNKEISLVYRKEILQRFSNMISQSNAIAVEEALFTGDGEKLCSLIKALLINSVSFFDTAKEDFYHGFMLGICALFGNSYVTSNREAGFGRYDIAMTPKNHALPGIIVELKAKAKCTDRSLKEAASDALKQIHDNKYDSNMKAKGINKIYKYGVAFCGKNVEVQVEE